ncbi:lipoprotein signal peptidase [Venatoribacter cucullus]|uniref:Lipoprotein signal peptidase n=1 Tax=Venatoribacter cucullus TaxID=2661630 RepID=A0A9X7V0K0_9GAMM|nr:signal peptidase II [Venatoribacter cucullus]QQD23404.1 lipoprotein signal peptidase [Venatoribacter cucullus]
MSKQASAAIWLWLAVAVFVLDIATKQLAEMLLVYAQPVEILPVLNFTLLYNPGAAFSFLADQSGWQRWFFTAIKLAVSIMLIVWITRLPRTLLWLPAALALILGGALGNLFDRVLFGHVIDFISVHWQNAYFPAFNLADSAISIGAVMMVVDVIRETWHDWRQRR